jgi:HEAT repeat protein
MEHAMAVLNLVERFRPHNDLDSYRRKLAGEINRQSLLRLLPALADLPLELTDPQGRACQIGAMLRQTRHCTIAGPSGGGRRLALLQYALRWAGAPEGSHPLPLLVRLPIIDDGIAPPAHILAAFIRMAELPGEIRPGREPRSLFRRSQPEALDPPQSIVLLVDGLDDVPAERREAWRTALLQTAQSNSTTHMLVTLPEHEPAWPGFGALTLATVTPAILASWVEHLTPPQHRAKVLAALESQPRLRPLRERLFEIALLAWLAPTSAMPESRAELYALALARMLELRTDQLDTSGDVAALQLLAAYDELPARVPAALAEPGRDGRPHFQHPHIRRYLAARQLVGEGRPDLIAELDLAEQSELALLLTTMLDDPAPLYPLLWEAGRRDADYLMILGRCLRERAPGNTAWALRIVAALAQIARDYPPPAAARADRLLRECLDALQLDLGAIVSADASIERFLGRLIELLPADLAAAASKQLILHTAMPEAFGWQLADRMLEHAELALPISAPIPSSDGVLARWIYLHALHPAQQRHALEPALAARALRAFGASGAGDTRILRAATAVIEDAALAPEVREAAIEALATNAQPTTQTVLERASADTNIGVRRAALTVLGRFDPTRAEIAWGRAAVDRSVDWELRLAAIQSLSTNLTINTAHLLALCASDARLPLFARLQAISSLGRHPIGHPELLQLLNRSDASEVARAAAARTLGTAGYAPAQRDLIRLLDSPVAAHTLIEGCCAGLGALKQPDAVDPLLALIERSYQDPTLTTAAIVALGQIGDARASEPLGRLLGAEALARLQRNLTPRLLQLPIESCIDNSAIPSRIIEHLASVLANTVTPEVQPTTLGEFLAGAADRVRAAAARALVALGGNTARAPLLAALLDDTAGSAATDIIAALAELDTTEDAEIFGYLLESSEVSSLTRWLVVQQLTSHPGGEPLMTRALSNSALDPFTRGALAEGLGQRQARAALPLLQQLADEPSTDAHLRSQAILGMGLLNDPSTEAILLRIACDTSEDMTLRGLAADYLPAQIGPESRRALRELLRGERQPAQLVIGALRTLGRAHDREALPLMLRYCQDTSTAIVQAAIDALVDMADGSVAPVLVRIAQQPNADHALRLQAVGALLKIGGEGYRPLLHSYMQQGALPFRLLALEALIGADTPPEELHAMLGEQSWPATLRLRILEYLAGDIAAAPLLVQMLESDTDVPQLRALAADSLGRLRWQAATPVLTRLAQSADTAIAIRLRCIAALRVLATNAGWAVIGRLAEDDKQPSAIRTHALAALCSIG